MEIQVVHAIVHTPEQARIVLKEAAAIADELEADGYPWEHVFAAAAGMLSARASVPIMPQQVPIDLARLGRGRG